MGEPAGAAWRVRFSWRAQTPAGIALSYFGLPFLELFRLLVLVLVLVRFDRRDVISHDVLALTVEEPKKPAIPRSSRDHTRFDCLILCFARRENIGPTLEILSREPTAQLFRFRDVALSTLLV